MLIWWTEYFCLTWYMILWSSLLTKKHWWYLFSRALGILHKQAHALIHILTHANTYTCTCIHGCHIHFHKETKPDIFTSFEILFLIGYFWNGQTENHCSKELGQQDDLQLWNYWQWGVQDFSHNPIQKGQQQQPCNQHCELRQFIHFALDLCLLLKSP